MSAYAQDFEALLIRYFEGDLDPIEQARFDALRVSSEAYQSRFWEVYDSRVAEQGLAAFAQGDPDLEGCFSFDTLEAYAAGALLEDEARVVRDHRCDLCGAQLASIASAAPAELVAGSPVTKAREALRPARGARRERRWARRRAIMIGLAVVAAMVLAFVVVRPPETPRFTPRGPEVTWEDLVDLEVMRGAGLPLASQASIDSQDKLRFVVTNRGEARYLSVFAVDAGGTVYWYFPAWMDPKANPRSITVRADMSKQLDEEIAHAFSPGPLVIVGLFTKTPRSVRGIETKLSGRGAAQLSEEALRTLFSKAAVRRLPLSVK